MQPVAVRILHPSSTSAAGLLERALVDARAANAERLADLFRAAGAGDVRIDSGAPDGRPFGARLRGLVTDLPADAGLVVLGSGAMPLAVRADAVALLETAAGGGRRALANSVYSADVVAIGAAANLASVPDLPSDNVLPRWLREQAGYEVRALSRPRLAMDLDSPIDVLLVEELLAGPPMPGRFAIGHPIQLPIGHPIRLPMEDAGPVRDRLARVRAIAGDARRQLVVAGRSSSSALRWLEAATASRTRALFEERGLRATGLAGDQAPPRSVLGMVLDDRGASALGSVLAELGDAAIVDTRVLLAHRLGADEAAWPHPEDRFASDLLLADRIGDPWLRDLTASARGARIPIVLGGHSVVGPGLRLVVRGRP